MTNCNVTIIGGGVNGFAVAHELSHLENVCLLEKNRTFPGENQTARNSGVRHAGHYYDKIVSPLKAKLCVTGGLLLDQLCGFSKEGNLDEDSEIVARTISKYVVATTEEETKLLKVLEARAKDNEVLVRRILGAEVRAHEPNIKAVMALEFPTSGLVEPTSLVKKLKKLANLGENFLLGTTVTGIKPIKEGFEVTAYTHGQGEYTFTTKYLVNSAGLESANIARMVNPDFQLEIYPVRGEFVRVRAPGLRISRNIYRTPVYYQKPDGSKHLTVGVHLIPQFAVDNKGDYVKKNGQFVLADEFLAGPWNRIRGKENIARVGYGKELATAEEFLPHIQKLMPEIEERDIELDKTGIQAVLANGSDFHIAPDVKYRNMINLVGICSPGLTSALATAKMVRSYLKK